MKIKNIFLKVKAYLESNELYRNNDEALVTQIWWQQINDMGLDREGMTLKKFLIMYRRGEFTAADVITRARRKCNEEHPHTRGKSYKPRQLKQEEVKAEIRSLTPQTPIAP